MINVRVYLGTPMSGYDRPTMIARAKEMTAIASEYGVTVISPVLVEHVSGKGKLIQDDEIELKSFWRHDKDIIRNRNGKGAHVVLIDRADKKSLGCEREYGLSRYCLWKPTLSIMQPRGYTVAAYEDDRIDSDEHRVFKYIADNYGTQFRRAKWRVKMLSRSLPGWIIDQIAAFR